MTLLKIIVIAGAEHLTDKTPANLRLLYRIGQHSNIATPLALFVRIELLCFIVVFIDKDPSLRIRLLLHKLCPDGFREGTEG